MHGDDLLIGILIGLILTLTGAGGSIIASPLLVFFAGVTINDATGLTLAAVCISSACMSVYGYWRGMFALQPVAALAISGMLAAPVARLVVEHLDSRLMGVLFALMALIFSTYYLLGDRIYAQWRKYFAKEFVGVGVEQNVNPPPQRALLAWGALAGALSGFFGVGGGIVLMPIVVRVLRVHISQAIYYCLPVICLITSTGSLTFIAHAENQILHHLSMLLIGALCGSSVGLALLPRMNPKKNLRILGIAVLFSGGATLYKTLA